MSFLENILKEIPRVEPKNDLKNMKFFNENSQMHKKIDEIIQEFKNESKKDCFEELNIDNKTKKLRRKKKIKKRKLKPSMFNNSKEKIFLYKNSVKELGQIHSKIISKSKIIKSLKENSLLFCLENELTSKFLSISLNNTKESYSSIESNSNTYSKSDDSAKGSFEKRDQPIKIISGTNFDIIRKTPFNEKLFLIEWENRLDGKKPENSYCTGKEIKEYAPLLLIKNILI